MTNFRLIIDGFIIHPFQNIARKTKNQSKVVAVLLFYAQQITFATMGSFKKKIDADSRTIEFSFMRVFSVEGPRFLVTTIKGNKAILFQMVMQKGQWGIKDDQEVPDWIYKIEHQLSQAITESNPLIE